MTLTAAVREAAARGSPLLAFNVVDLASLLAVGQAARRVARPFIAQASPRTVLFYGPVLLRRAVEEVTNRLGVKCFLHLDHCHDEVLLDRVIAARFDGFMVDYSDRSFADNMRLTLGWVRRGHDHGLAVEGEVSAIKGTEEGAVEHRRGTPTSVESCLEYAETTQADLVGADIGTAHGRYASEPSIRFDVIDALDGRLNAGFVVHGGSGLNATVLARLARKPVAKVNFSTDLKDAWAVGVGEEVSGNPTPEPLAALREANRLIEAMALEKFQALRSDGV